MGNYYKGTGWGAEVIGSVDDDGTIRYGTGRGAEAVVGIANGSPSVVRTASSDVASKAR